MKTELITTDPNGETTTTEVKPKSGRTKGQGRKPYVTRTPRERLRNRLHALVKMAMASKGLNFGKVKIAYELLLKDEAAQLERDRFEFSKCEAAEKRAAAKPVEAVIVTQEEFTKYVRHVLGKEIAI